MAITLHPMVQQTMESAKNAKDDACYTAAHDGKAFHNIVWRRHCAIRFNAAGTQDMWVDGLQESPRQKPREVSILNLLDGKAAHLALLNYDHTGKLPVLWEVEV